MTTPEWLKPGLVGAGVGAVALAAVGFGWGGWVTGGAAESMLLGRPTIATSVGGLPDLVKDGETGWLVPPHAPQQLADAIVDSLARPAEAARRAAAGAVLCRQLMDVRRTGAEVVTIYSRILDRDAARQRDL